MRIGLFAAALRDAMRAGQVHARVELVQRTLNHCLGDRNLGLPLDTFAVALTDVAVMGLVGRIEVLHGFGEEVFDRLGIGPTEALVGPAHHGLDDVSQLVVHSFDRTLLRLWKTFSASDFTST